MARSRIRRWGWCDTIVCVAAAMYSAGGASRAAASGYALDGATTYCWSLSMDAFATVLSPRSVIATGSGTGCPLAVTFVAKNASIHVDDAMRLTWTVTSSSASSGPDAFATINASASEEESATCDPLSAEFQSANLSAVQRANVTSFSRNGLITFYSNGEVAFSAPGEYTLAAYVVVSGVDKNQRHDFVVYTAVSVLSEDTTVGAAPDADSGNARDVAGDNGTTAGNTTMKKRELPFDLSLGQFIVMCALCALLLAGSVAVLVMSTKRKITARKKEKGRPKGSHTAALSPITGESGQLRFSDWSEIYATQDALPSSILMDDSNTIAILRASRVSSPTHSAHVERKVADFTRDVGYWDIRPSASPITPLSSFFFPSSASSQQEEDDADGALASPTDSFVSLETLGRRRTLPCYIGALDDRGLANGCDDTAVDVEAQEEVEFEV